MGLATFIEEESREPATLEHVKMIKNGIYRLDQYIKNILSYSRNNRRAIEVERISVAAKTREVIQMLINARHAEHINFQIDINEDVAFYSDEHSFSVILQNLISNALKFHKIDQDDRYVRIIGSTSEDALNLSIEDNGIGIPKEHQTRIFDMFFRVSGAVEGSGIGLYITKEILEKLQGSISVDSAEGQGTQFHITIKNLKP